MLRSEAGDADAAITYFQEALQRRRSYPEAHHDLGIVYMHKGDYERAIDEFQLALKVKSDFEPAFLALSQAYEQNRKTDQARQVLAEYLKRFGARDSAYVREAQSRLEALQ